jgi:Ala-tRNA(Pro) deacylase
MSIPRHVEEFLTAHEIDYVRYVHGPESTAERTARRLHIDPADFAKCVVAVDGGRLAVAVIPASERLDLEALSELMEVPEMRLASTDECEGRFRDCEPGAAPPFGRLYGVPVFLDFAFENRRLMSFKAGTHSDVIQMCLDDFRRVVRPRTGRLIASAPRKSKSRTTSLSAAGPSLGM